jgi:hypothetical protein
MGIDHRRFHVFVTEKLLGCPDIVTTFQQVSCEGIAKAWTVHVGQESVDSLFGCLHWMAHVVEIDEPPDPAAVSLLGSSAILAGAQGFAEAI